MPKLNLKKNQMIQQYFSKTLTPDLNEKGTTHQVLFSMSDKNIFKFIEKHLEESQKHVDKRLWVCSLFLKLYTRDPSEDEMSIILSLINTPNMETNKKNIKGVLWALINSPEFKLY